MGPFSIDPESIKRLDPAKLVWLVRRLLVQQATLAGMPRDAISVPSDITTADGGLDARVGESGKISVEISKAAPSGTQYLPEGQSGWQMKSGHTIQIEVQKAPLVKQGRKWVIAPEVKKLLDEGGTYVLVCGGVGTPNKSAWEKAIQDKLAGLGAPDAKVKVCTADDLATWAEQFPSLVIELNGHVLGECLWHQRWGQEANISSIQYVEDEERRILRESIRSALLNPLTDGFSVFRILGHTGVGKTRLVYEALDHDDLRDYVVYLRYAENAGTALITYLADSSSKLAILVVDDCDSGQHIKLSEVVSPHAKKISLITMWPEVKADAEPTERILKPLGNDSAKELVKTVNKALPDDAIRRIITFAEGYPRILANLARDIQEDVVLYSPASLARYGIDEMVNRLLAGRRDPGDVAVQKTKQVLSALSLFERLGWDDEVCGQGQAVCTVLGIDWQEAKHLVAEQINRGLVRKLGRFRAVTPRSLCFHLNDWWWQGHDCTEAKNLIDSLPNRQSKDWFFERMAMMARFEGAKQCASRLLNDEDFFQRELSPFRWEPVRSLYYLARINPVATVAALVREFDGKSIEELKAIDQGRWWIVSALEWAACWKACFFDAARLLFRLAEAENQTYGNNATAIWKMLFSPYLSYTEVPLDERVGFLKKLLDEANQDQQLLVLEGFSGVLLDITARMAIDRDEDAVKPPNEWRPKIWNDLWQPMREALSVLLGLVKGNKGEVSEKAVNIIIGQARDLVSKGLGEDVANAFSELKNVIDNPVKRLLETTVHILNYNDESLSPKAKEKFGLLFEELKGNDFVSKLRRLAGMPAWADDGVEEDWKVREERKNKEIIELAREVIKNPSILDSEINWLFSPEAENASALGIHLAGLDVENKWLEKLWKTLIQQSNPNSGFLRGYVLGLSQRDREACENFLDSVADHPEGRHFLPDLCSWLIFTEKTWQRILRGIDEGWLREKDLYFLGYGPWSSEISQHDFTRFAEGILSRLPGTAQLLVDIASFYLHNKKETESELLQFLEKIVLSDELLGAEKSIRADIYYGWHEIATRLVKADPQKAESIVTFTLKRRLADDSYHGDRYCFKVVAACLEVDPAGSWKAMEEFLTVSIDNSLDSLKISHMFNRNLFSSRTDECSRSLFEYVPRDELFQWCGQQPETRAVLVARSVQLHGKENLDDLARELLIQFGHLDKVSSALSINLYNEGWSGSLVKHYERRLELLNNWLNDGNPNVRRWIEGRIAATKHLIEQETKREEEEFR